MCQITPWVNTLCSYSATSAPSEAGVRRSPRIVLVGRLPSKVLCGTSQSGAPSARTSSGRLAERQRLGLGEDVGHQEIVVLARAG